jgi:autotransporter adhesin
VAPTDAVNVGQLNSGLSNTLNQANAYTDQRFLQVADDMWSLNRQMRGGTASAMAMAGLPQAYLPGKSMAAVAISSYEGEAGLAIGVSTISENGRYVYKLQGTGNTARDWGVTVGAGIQW